MDSLEMKLDILLFQDVHNTYDESAENFLLGMMNESTPKWEDVQVTEFDFKNAFYHRRTSSVSSLIIAFE